MKKIIITTKIISSTKAGLKLGWRLTQAYYPLHKRPQVHQIKYDMAYFTKFSVSSKILKPVESLFRKSMNVFILGITSLCLC